MLERLAKWLAGGAADELEGLRFVFNVPFGQALAAALLLALGLCVAAFFWLKLTRLQPLARGLLIALRALAIVLALFLLLDPCITGKRVRRTDRAVLLLFDDSQSMQVAGPAGQTRGQRLQEHYAAVQTEFEQALREKCQLVFCRFPLPGLGFATDGAGIVLQAR